MSYGTNKCAACNKRTQCSGKRYNDKIRYLCQRDYCQRLRRTWNGAGGKPCGTCGVSVFKNMVDCWSCDPGGRKVSTEGKAASGTTPDSGSIPGYSTSEELSVMAEDLADLRDELKKMQEQFKELKSTVVALQMIPSIPMTGGGRGGASAEHAAALLPLAVLAALAVAALPTTQKTAVRTNFR